MILLPLFRSSANLDSSTKDYSSTGRDARNNPKISRPGKEPEPKGTFHFKAHTHAHPWSNDAASLVPFCLSPSLSRFQRLDRRGEAETSPTRLLPRPSTKTKRRAKTRTKRVPPRQRAAPPSCLRIRGRLARRPSGLQPIDQPPAEAMAGRQAARRPQPTVQKVITPPFHTQRTSVSARRWLAKP